MYVEGSYERRVALCAQTNHRPARPLHKYSVYDKGNKRVVVREAVVLWVLHQSRPGLRSAEQPLRRETLTRCKIRAHRTLGGHLGPGNRPQCSWIKAMYGAIGSANEAVVVDNSWVKAGKYFVASKGQRSEAGITMPFLAASAHRSRLRSSTTQSSAVVLRFSSLSASSRHHP